MSPTPLEDPSAAPSPAAPAPSVRTGSRASAWRAWLFDAGPSSTGEPSRRVKVGRAAQVVLGLVSIGFAVVVLASPDLSLEGLLILIAEAVGLVGAQSLLSGGRLLFEQGLENTGPRYWWRLIRSWGLLGVGLVVVALAAFALFDPSLAITAAVFVLAVALVLQGIARIFQAGGLDEPRWFRGSLVTTGVLMVLLVVASIAFEGFALPGFAILVGLILIVTGVETVVTGLHPTDPRQFVILKLILFAAFYGLILINWIDLFGKSVPAYGVWLVLTYMAPFGVLLVFEGWTAWPLATSLGLLVSLMNDVGYFFVGNLLFGFHENLGPWIAGQLGLQGNQLVTIFEGGSFRFDVTSWMMGLSIYARAVVVGLILYYWWRHPSGLVTRDLGPAPATPG